MHTCLVYSNGVNTLWPGDTACDRDLGHVTSSNGFFSYATEPPSNQYWLIINGFCGFRVRAIFQEVFMIYVCKINLKIAFYIMTLFPRGQWVNLQHTRKINWSVDRLVAIHFFSKHVLCSIITKSRLSDKWIHMWFRPPLTPTMSRRIFGTRPLLEPMPAYYHLGHSEEFPCSLNNKRARLSYNKMNLNDRL